MEGKYGKIKNSKQTVAEIQATDDGDIGHYRESCKWEKRFRTFLKVKLKGLLIDWTQDFKEKKVKIIPRLLAWATGKIELVKVPQV